MLKLLNILKNFCSWNNWGHISLSPPFFFFTQVDLCQMTHDYLNIQSWLWPSSCNSISARWFAPTRSRLQRRGRAVRGLRVSYRRPLPAARKRALLARDLRQMRRVSERAQRDLLLQGPPALLQARLWKVRFVF